MLRLAKFIDFVKLSERICLLDILITKVLWINNELFSLNYQKFKLV